MIKAEDQEMNDIVKRFKELLKGPHISLTNPILWKAVTAKPLNKQHKKIILKIHNQLL